MVVAVVLAMGRVLPLPLIITVVTSVLVSSCPVGTTGAPATPSAPSEPGTYRLGRCSHCTCHSTSALHDACQGHTIHTQRARTRLSQRRSSSSYTRTPTSTTAQRLKAGGRGCTTTTDPCACTCQALLPQQARLTRVAGRKGAAAVHSACVGGL